MLIGLDLYLGYGISSPCPESVGNMQLPGSIYRYADGLMALLQSRESLDVAFAVL